MFHYMAKIIKIKDELKDVNQLTFNKEFILDYLDWPNLNTC